MSSCSLTTCKIWLIFYPCPDISWAVFYIYCHLVSSHTQSLVVDTNCFIFSVICCHYVYCAYFISAKFDFRLLTQKPVKIAINSRTLLSDVCVKIWIVGLLCFWYCYLGDNKVIHAPANRLWETCWRTGGSLSFKNRPILFLGQMLYKATRSGFSCAFTI